MPASLRQMPWPLARLGAAAALAAAASGLAEGGLPDGSCLLQASAHQPGDSPVAALWESRDGLGARELEDGMKCQTIADPARPEEGWQPDFVRCKAMQRQTAAGCGKGQCDVVFVGDSITERLSGEICYILPAIPSKSRKMGKAFHDTFRYSTNTLILAGSGDSTPQTLYMLQEVLPVLHSPKVFFVMIGTNNLGVACSSAQEAVLGIKAVVSKLRRAHPKSRILLHPLLNRAGNGCCRHPLQSTVDEVNNELQAFIQEKQTRIEIVDCGHVFPKGWGEEARTLMPDKLHPSVEGYEEWIRCLNPEFEKVLGKL